MGSGEDEGLIPGALCLLSGGWMKLGVPSVLGEEDAFSDVVVKVWLWDLVSLGAHGRRKCVVLMAVMRLFLLV